MRARRDGSPLAEFEEVYRGDVSSVTAYFARRCVDPQTVADLTSETIVRAAAGFGGFDPGRGTARAWLFRIARNVYAGYCEQMSNRKAAARGLAGLADLPADEVDELVDRIDAQRAVRSYSSAARSCRRWSGRRSSWSMLTASPRRRRRRRLASPEGCCGCACQGRGHD